MVKVVKNKSQSYAVLLFVFSFFFLDQMYELVFINVRIEQEFIPEMSNFLRVK